MVVVQLKDIVVRECGGDGGAAPARSPACLRLSAFPPPACLPQDGAKPFADVWNEWVHPAALPALSMSESFLQAEEIYVSISATAYVPRKPFT